MATWAERKAAAYQRQREFEAQQKQAGGDDQRWASHWKKPQEMPRPQQMPEKYTDEDGVSWKKLRNCNGYVRDYGDAQPRQEEQRTAEPTFKVDLEPDNDAPALCS